MPRKEITAAEGRAAYEDHLRGTLKRAENTIRGAMGAIDRFLGGHPTDLMVKDFTAEMFDAWQADKFAGYAQTTRNLQIGHLKRWLVFLLEEGWLGADRTPWRKMVAIKKPKRTRAKSFVRQDDTLPALVRAGMEWHPRNGYFILVTYWMCRRVSEMSPMRVSDIDFTPRPNADYGVFTFEQIKVNGESQSLPIPEPLVEPLKEWLKVYEELIGRKLVRTDYLFPALRIGKAQSRKGVRMPLSMIPTKKLPYDSAHDIIDRAYKMADIVRPPGAALHGLRRGGLDDLIKAANEAGIPNAIRLAMTMAGHGDERTTENYTDNHREVWELGKALAKIHGRAVEAPEVPAEAPTSGTAAARAARAWGVA
jgi:integrase